MTSAAVVGSSREQLQAVALAAVCAILFLGEALLPGRALVPFPPELQDVYAAEAKADDRFDPADAYRGKLCMGDKYAQSLAWDRIMQDRLRDGELPLWTEDIAGGANFVPQMAQVYQPWNLLLLLVPSAEVYGYWYLLHLVLFGWLGYRFFRRIGAEHAGSLLGVVVLVLGMWTQCKLHHNVILTAALSLFPMLSSIHDIARRGGGRRSIAWLSLWTGLTWMSGFVVVSVLQSYLAVAWALFLCLRNGRGERRLPLLRCALGMALGGVLSAAHMVPVLLASVDTARAAATTAGLAGGALEWDYLLTLVWPDLLHWAGDRFYPERAELVRPALSTLVFVAKPIEQTGYNWVETSFAIGIAPLLCAMLGIADRGRRAVVWFFAAGTVLAFAYASATLPVFQLSRLLPGLGAADVKRGLYLVAMGLAVMTAVGANRVVAGPVPRWCSIAVGAVALISGAIAAWLFAIDADGLVDALARLISLDSSSLSSTAFGGDAGRIADAMRGEMTAGFEAEPAVNLSKLRTTFVRATLAAGATFGVLRWLTGSRRMWALIAIGAVELLHAGHGPVVAVPAERVTTPPAIVEPVLAAAEEAPGVRPRFQRLGDPAEQRVFSLYPPNLPGFHGIEDLACYNPLPPARMEQLFLAIEPDPAPDEPPKVSVVWGGAGVGWFRRDESLQHPLVDVLGIRYVLSSRPVELPSLVDRTPAEAAAPFRLYERTTCLPRATFVRRAKVIADAAPRLVELAKPRRDARTEVILEDPTAPLPAGEESEAKVEIVEHRDELVRVRVEASAAGYLRLADPYDPGWTATIDGAATRVYVADHYLRAVWVPAGEHEIVFAFDGARVVWPPWISLLALLVTLALAFVPGWHRRA